MRRLRGRKRGVKGIDRLQGNLTGLKASWLRALERIGRKRMPVDEVVTPELARSLAELSAESGRQIGVLIARDGQVDRVLVGDSESIHIPHFERARVGRSRFCGYRFIHTHLDGRSLSREDLTDLALLRLDLIGVIGVSPQGLAAALQIGHMLPGAAGEQAWRVLDPGPLSSIPIRFREFIRSLEEEYLRLAGPLPVGVGERAYLLGIDTGAREKKLKDLDSDGEEPLGELAELARSSGIEVVGSVLQRRTKLDPRFLIGRGKLEEVVIDALQMGATMLIFDHNLTPSQARSLSTVTDLKVLDRTQLILDIFSQRAHSRDGKIQVELAQLRYLMPRLVTRDDALSRLTGGIGGRGPGETRLEVDKRRARDRIRRLEHEIELLSRGRAQRRSRRVASGVPVVSIVGYTNAGKSTLFNALTGSLVVTGPRMFATLDPTHRRLRMPSGCMVVLTDTVGFIRDLPPDLAKAFRATLEELEDADLLLHVVDGSSPLVSARVGAVEAILAELGLGDKPRVIVLNKADRLRVEDVRSLERDYDAVAVSALHRETLAPLLDRLDRQVSALRPRDGQVKKQDEKVFQPD